MLKKLLGLEEEKSSNPASGRLSARGSSVRKTSIMSRSGYRSGFAESILRGWANLRRNSPSSSPAGRSSTGWIMTVRTATFWASYRILKPPQATKPGKKAIPPPAWRLIGKSVTGGFGFTDSVHFSRVPSWVQNKIEEFKSGPVVNSVYRLKGRKFRYKIVFDYKGQGVLVTEVYRRPRTWFWKKLKAKS